MVVVQARVVDSTHLELSKPIGLEQGEHVVVSFAEPGDGDTEREMWLSASAAFLAAAYGDDEPDYASSLVRESNPEYKA